MMTFWPFINIIVHLLHNIPTLYVCYVNHPQSIWNGPKIFRGGIKIKIIPQLHLCWEYNECECLEAH